MSPYQHQQLPGELHGRPRWRPPAEPPPAEPDPERDLRIERLHDEIRRLEALSTPRQPTDDQVRGLQLRIVQRQIEIRHHKQHIAEASAAIARLQREIAGVERAVEAFLIELLGKAVEAARPHWSPMPVLGFRAWAPADGGLRGARVVWESPRLTARCTHGQVPDDRDIPHSDGRCGRLGCGVYAVKDPRWLLSETLRSRGSAVFGVVMLSGKVVEHERGYRAAVAEVVAVAARHRGKIWASSDAACVCRLFADPAATIGSLEGTPSGTPESDIGWRIIDSREDTIGYLADQARRVKRQWT